MAGLASVQNGKLGGRRKGRKNDKTIAKEEARKVFEEMQLKHWLAITEAQAKDAMQDRQAREYSINQVIGKPKEVVEMTVDASVKLDV